MEVSKRSFIKSYVTKDNFLQYRQTNINSLLPSLFVSSIDLFIIYDTSKEHFGAYLEKVKEFVPDLAFQYFGDFKNFFLGQSIESFDKLTEDPNFIQFVKQTSNKIVKRLKTRITSASLS